jgi:hypothetical protein
MPVTEPEEVVASFLFYPLKFPNDHTIYMIETSRQYWADEKSFCAARDHRLDDAPTQHLGDIL